MSVPLSLFMARSIFFFNIPYIVLLVSWAGQGYALVLHVGALTYGVKLTLSTCATGIITALDLCASLCVSIRLLSC